MKTEWHPCLAALAVQVGDPFEVERTGMFARFATHRYLFDQLGVEIGGEVDALEHGGHDDEPVSEGQRHEQRQAPVGAVLILDGTSHGHVFISVAPVGREAPVEALDALGEEKETAVPAPAYNLPYPVAPSVGLLYQQVGREAERELGARRVLPVAPTVASERQVERCRPAHLVRWPGGTEGGILAIDIAVPAPLAYLVASVPRIPHQHQLFLNLSIRARAKCETMP